MAELIGKLKSQSVSPQIFLWNNDPNLVFKDDRVDWIINSSRNVHCRAMVFMAQQVDTPFLCTMDDDLYPADSAVLADMRDVLTAQWQPTQMVGAYGVKVYNGGTYSNGPHISIPKGHGQFDDADVPLPGPKDQRVDLVKGRIVMMRTVAAQQLRSRYGHIHHDLHVTMTLAGDKRLWHVLAGCLYDRENRRSRLVDFPVDDLGYSAWPEHMAERDRLTDEWLSQCAIDARVKDLPPDAPVRT